MVRTLRKASRNEQGSHRGRAEPALAPPAPATPLGLRIVLPIIVGLAAFAAFLPARRAEFLNWDDDKVVLTNPNFRGFNSANLRWMFTQNKMGHYHPLTWVSYAIDDAIGKARYPSLPPAEQRRYETGLDPSVFHTTNLLLHAGVAVAFYFLAVSLLRLAIPAASPWSIHTAAAWAAIFFGVHPLRVESVAWITERRDLLSSLFLLPAISCYLVYARQQAGPARRIAAYVGSIVLLALSLLSKAWGMTLPVILLLLDVYPLRRIGRRNGGATGDANADHLPVAIAEKVPHALLALGFAIRAAQAQRSQLDTTKTLAEWGVLDRVMQAFYGLVFYVEKTLAPVRLTPLVQLPPHNNPFALRYVVAAIVVFASVVLLVAMRKRWPASAVVAACYVILVSPVLGFLQSGPQLVADRYSYLACLPWALAAAAGVIWLIERTRGRGVRAVAVAVCAAVLPVLAVLTWRQTGTWHDSYALWERAVRIDPDCVLARGNLGMLEMARSRDLRSAADRARREGDDDAAERKLADAKARAEAAIAHYRAALAVDNRDPIVLNNLASALREDPARRDEALAIQRHAVEVMPSNPDLYFALADMLLDFGKLDEALASAQECIRLGNPPRAKHYRVLGRVYMARQEYAEAEEPYLAALDIERRVDPRSKAVINCLDVLGRIARATNRPADAVSRFREILQIEPGNGPARQALQELGASDR